MTDWERFDAPIFPGQAWKLETEHAHIQVAEVPGDDVFIVIQPPEPTIRERFSQVIRSRIPFVTADRTVTTAGVPFDTEDDAKQFGEALANQLAANSAQ